ncbi:multidrug effflux MFS transporter [Loktanella salsilacus]|uniref:multidrug effflux MFS transporter n=1 Tax=Loktanella salsilacus TaxID=195913 RepID=UPI0037367087
MNTDQPRLGQRGTLVLLIVLAAFPPMTMDLYLPALPQIADALDSSSASVNLTLGAYMVAYACAMLFWGPLSEKTGRKPILLLGLALYVAACIGCATTTSIDGLIAFRTLQGLGGGAVTVVETAIVKDLYDGRDRERIMATIMSLVVIAPMLAPVLGAALLTFASWHALFVLLALFGLIVAGLVLMLHEPLRHRYHGSLIGSWARLGHVLKNPRFVCLLLIFALGPMCLMGFIGSAAYIYVDGFGLSEQTFSLIFAFNAACSVLGPMLYLRLTRRLALPTVVLGAFAVLALAGAALVLFGGVSHWLFAAIAAVATVAVVALRVPGANLMLDQQTSDTGSVAALMMFSSMLMGAAGVQVVAAWPDQMIRALGLLFVISGGTSTALWLFSINRWKAADPLTQTT